MNVVAELSKKYTYRQIAERIEQTTGRKYNHLHIGNVARGSKGLHDSLLYHLSRTFPEYFAADCSPKMVDDYQEGGE